MQLNQGYTVSSANASINTSSIPGMRLNQGYTVTSANASSILKYC